MNLENIYDLIDHCIYTCFFFIPSIVVYTCIFFYSTAHPSLSSFLFPFRNKRATERRSISTKCRDTQKTTPLPLLFLCFSFSFLHIYTHFFLFPFIYLATSQRLKEKRPKKKISSQSLHARLYNKEGNWVRSFSV